MFRMPRCKTYKLLAPSDIHLGSETSLYQLTEGSVFGNQLSRVSRLTSLLHFFCDIFLVTVDDIIATLRVVAEPPSFSSISASVSAEVLFFFFQTFLQCRLSLRDVNVFFVGILPAVLVLYL